MALTREQERLRRTITGNLLAAMTWNGYDREKAAAMIGIARTTLNNKISGKSAWTCDEIAAIAKIAKVPADEILRRAK